MTKQKALSVFNRTTIIKIEPPYTGVHQESRIESYRHKVDILKQIMSEKAHNYRKINAAQNIATVVVSSLLLFFGFSGIDKISLYISWIYTISKEAVELGFNIFVFFLFVIGVLHLVFRFSEKQTQSERAVALLAALGNELDDMIVSSGNLIVCAGEEKIESVRRRYEAIAETIPANSDKEFIRAKQLLSKKESYKPKIKITPQALFDPNDQETIVSSIVLGSRAIVDAMRVLKEDNDHSLYLGGGLIRNAVWDFLHGYSSPTPVDDVDVVYFDPVANEKRHDESIELKLLKRIPNIRWSVKNQARMHSINGDKAYQSLEEAIARWPETATAIIVRFESDMSLEFIAPWGFDDLLRMIVTNTPAFSDRTEDVRKRWEEKQWQRIWPRLKLWLPGKGDVSGEKEM